MGDEAKNFRPLFPRKHISPILSSIFQAGKTLKKKTNNDLENWISARLYWRLIRIYPFRDGPLDIRLQPQIVSIDSDENTALGQIDFIVSCGMGAEIYFAIEAKRLRVRSEKGRLKAGNDEYVKNGMMRFVSGQYAPFTDAGAMLGYVYDGDTDKAHVGISGYIQLKKDVLKLMGPKQLVRSSILPNKPVEETKHDLDNRVFTIYHIFLGV